MIVEQATIGDLPVIIAMRQETGDWLAKKGINQWAVAWPNPEAQAERILSSIRAGETWMIRTDDGDTAATVALDRERAGRTGLVPPPPDRPSEVHRYYEQRGFKHVRTLDLDYPSGALFQRAATDWREQPDASQLAEQPQIFQLPRLADRRTGWPRRVIGAHA
ncbi:GNAT family N-acetyltransferase [Kribbella sp. DT2]|uniref:GNAT family N-acetyltransferase n=1 Tax=Kribbella sp. DT2 TaxID=3393427 RepID=UPI003CEC4B81